MQLEKQLVASAVSHAKEYTAFKGFKV